MKTQAEKELIKFKNQLHNLLIRNPSIRIGVDKNGDVVAFIFDGHSTVYPRVHLPTSGQQEPIKVLTASGVAVSL